MLSGARNLNPAAWQCSTRLLNRTQSLDAEVAIRREN